MIRLAIKHDILALLTKEGPMTCRQIANRIGCTPNGAGYAMRHAPNDFHVSDWTINSQQIWSAGKGTHAPRPEAKPPVPKAGLSSKVVRLRDEAKLKQGYVEHRVWGI